MNNKSNYKRIAIKIGSNVLIKENGELNTKRIEHIISQIAHLHNNGVELILISSGAVAAGRGMFKFSKSIPETAEKQVWSAIGQVQLMMNYFAQFASYDIQAAQVLATKENFQGIRYYSNMQTCISAMLDNKIIPIINENDTINVNELMFTDNDELSGWISGMMNCDALFVLTVVDGVFTGVPGSNGAKLIYHIETDDSHIERYITSEKSEFGKGGMLTKYTIAQQAANIGINVFVANGNRNNILLDILSGIDVPYTHFKTSRRNGAKQKKWEPLTTILPKASIILTGSKAKLLKEEKMKDICVEDIINFESYFDIGDIINVFDDKGNQMGIGKAQYSSENIKYDKGNGKQIVINTNLLLLYKRKRTFPTVENIA